MPETHLLREIATRCESLGIALILDEAFIDLLPGSRVYPVSAREPAYLGAAFAHQVLCDPGAASGYLVNSNEQAVAQMRSRQMPWSINAFAALAGEMILRDSAYQRATWKWLEQEGGAV
ncbi:threonine-phosphate decarboxylase [Citrobacter freundii]|nr:threonine-phosphate decarboxylase [Citrobacter freundii]